MPSVEVRIRIDFSPALALGPGKIALLEGIRRTGSLARAAREMGMGYRRAWLLLQSVNALFDEPAAVATTGGRGGGGAALTRHGEALIRAYRRLEAAVAARAAREFRTFMPATGRRAKAIAPVKRLSRTPRVRGARDADAV